jgi:alanine transaminase
MHPFLPPQPLQVIYLHCWGGRGRAGTVGACLLGKAWGVPAAEALARVQRSFDTRRDGGRLSPETDEQRQYVERYIAAAQSA